MGVREIPKAYEYTCDQCGEKHRQENAAGHYTNSRPPRWSWLTFARDALDYQGLPIGDGTIKRLLCSDCTPLPKLSTAARARIIETIEAEEAVGDSQVASDIQFLLDLHDRVHGLKEAVS